MSAPLHVFARGPVAAPVLRSPIGMTHAKEKSLFAPSASRRDRLWELSPNLHCSIIGTCLTTADLRSLIAKLGIADAGRISEHDLHAQAVSRASKKDDGGKLLHKLLDRRHDREIHRFGKATDVDGVRDLWRSALEKGDVSGAYWAVMTHPLTDRELVKEAFGEVHMLSHLLGRSVRADLRRLAEVEAETKVHLDAIAALEARIAELTRSWVTSERHGDDLERDLRRERTMPRVSKAQHEAEQTICRMQEQLGRAQARAAAEEERRIEAERVAHRLAAEVRDGAHREADLCRELACLEENLSPSLDGNAVNGSDLAGLTLLYVGGRPRQVAQARLALSVRGVELLAHDGGIDEATTLLPGLVSRADVVVFPVDCVSHDAMGAVKKTCRDLGRRCIPLRSTGLTSLLASFADIAASRR